MIFIERAALEQQPPEAVEHKHREGAMKDALAMGAHLVDDADFLIVLVDAHEHRSGGHPPPIYTGSSKSDADADLHLTRGVRGRQSQRFRRWKIFPRGDVGGREYVAAEYVVHP